MVEGRERVPHQLLIHMDAPPNDTGNIEIRYSYPFSGEHSVPETVVPVLGSRIPEEVVDAIEIVRSSLLGYVQPQLIRLPHSDEIRPVVRPGILTVVVQDQRRKQELPAMRLYAYEEVSEIPSQREVEVRLGGKEVPDELRSEIERITEFCKKEAWKHYESKFRHLLRAKRHRPQL